MAHPRSRSRSVRSSSPTYTGQLLPKGLLIGEEKKYWILVKHTFTLMGVALGNTAMVPKMHPDWSILVI